MDTRSKMVHAVTEYDRKQSAKRSYSIYALGHYLTAIDETCRDIAEQHISIRAALASHFTGRLLDVVLKSVGEPKFTEDERRKADSSYFRSIGL